MKLLIFSRDFFPSIGGVQRIAAELARGLADQSSDSAGAEEINITLATETPCINAADCRFPFTVVRHPGFWRLARLVRQADVVHLAGPAIMPLVLTLLLRRPVIVEHHGFQTICPNGQLFLQPDASTCPGHFMARRYGKCLACNCDEAGTVGSLRMLLLTPLRRWLCNRAASNVMPTRWLASQLKLNREKYIPHGIRTDAPSRPAGMIEPSNLIFAYQGRLVSTKGVRLLLEAFEQLCLEGRSVRLIVIGTGPEEGELKSTAAKFAGRVQFFGELPDELLKQTLLEAATVVMPSLAGEVFGLVAVENMQRGKLLIVSDLGSLSEVVGDTGLIFPVGDAAALAACMRAAIDDSSRARRIARAGQSRAEQVFAAERMIREHISLYREVYNSTGRRMKIGRAAHD